MEILFVSHKHPPLVGGMQKQSYELVNGMRKYATVHSIVYKGKGSLLWFFLTLNRSINTICRQNPGITVIHYNDGLMAAVCLLHTGYEHLAKAVTLHGLDLVFPNRFYRKYLLLKFNKFRYIFTVSQATATAGIRLGLSPEKLVVISNGVDPGIASLKATNSFETIARRHNLSTRNKTLLVAWGRAVKRKGFSWFIDNVMPDLEHDCVLLIIGPFSSKTPFIEYVFRILPRRLKHQVELFSGYPSDEKSLRKLLRDPLLDGKVKHLGILSFEEIVALLQRADAFVMPNISVEGDMEGFGLVCLEASLIGTLVFASDVDGIPAAIHHGENGTLVEAGNAGAWAAALNNGLTKHRNCPAIAEAGAYTLKTFSWDKMAEQYFSFFNRVK